MTKSVATTKFLSVLNVLLVTAIATPSNAQTAATPQTSQVTVVQVKPDMDREWREYLTKDINPALTKGGVKLRHVFATASLGEQGVYVMVTPLSSLAEFDNPSPVVTALGPEGSAALGVKRTRMVLSSRTYMITARPELGVTPAAGYQAKLAVSARSIVAPSHIQDFMKHTKELSAVMAKTNAKGVLVSQDGLGGNPNEFTTLVLFDSFADIGKFPAAFAKAAAEATLGAAPAGTILNTEWRVYRYATALSILPATR